MRDTSFHDYVVEDTLGGLEGITSKGMFGGWGVYKDGTIFAIISDGELYFKVDNTNRAEFETMNGSHIFSYERQGKTQELSYWSIPEEIMEDKERLYELVHMSFEVSKNTKK